MLCCTKPTLTSSVEGFMGDDLGIQEILTSIDQLKSKADGKDQDLTFLAELLQSQQFKSIIKVHEMVTTPDGEESNPIHNNLSSIVDEVFSAVNSHSSILEVEELLNLLSTSHFKAFAKAYDQIAAKDFQPRLPDIPYEVDEDDDIAVKIVRIVKGATEPLGATIHRNEETGIIRIARIMHGGAADRCGLIHIGDVVNEVNGVRVAGKPPEEVVKLLSSAMGPVTLTLMPGDSDLEEYKDTKMRVRTHFSYDPTVDRSIPCHEVGLSFKTGDVLEIVCQDDPLWWQARREGDRNARAGLIPGRLLMERRETARTAAAAAAAAIKNSPDIKNHKSILRFSPKSKSSKKSQKKTTQLDNEEKDHDEMENVFYEEVEKYFPKAGKNRPIVLIGPSGVGRNELKQRLISSAPDHYCEAVPHTSRPKRSNEIDGVDYYFFSRKEMENSIFTKKFVEYGEYQGNLYGTTFDQLKTSINDGRVCILCPHAQSLKTLRCSDVKPCVIFVKPPQSLEKLIETRSTAKKRSPSKSTPSTTSSSSLLLLNQDNSRQFTEEEFKEMLNCANKLETIYGSYSDHVIINDDVTQATNELISIARCLETEPCWIPVAWIQ